MWILFGFIGGIGMGFVYLPTLVMVGYYFEKKRAIATGQSKRAFFIPFTFSSIFDAGIVTAGAGIGSITFGPLSHFLFDKLKWKLGLLVLTAIVLCCVFFCLFMRPLKSIRKRRIIVPTDDENVVEPPVSFLLSTNLTISTSIRLI